MERGHPVRLSAQRERGSSPTVREGVVSTTCVSGWVKEASLILREDVYINRF
jgi:hypothetical protein